MDDMVKLLNCISSNLLKLNKTNILSLKNIVAHIVVFIMHVSFAIFKYIKSTNIFTKLILFLVDNCRVGNTLVRYFDLVTLYLKSD